MKTTADAADGREEKEEVEELGFADAVIAEAERELKRRRVHTVADGYVSTIHVLSQSNLCERLFSLAKLVMSDRRQSMNPTTLNNLLLLKLNHTFWTVSDIHSLLITIGEGEPDIEVSDDEEDKEESEDEEDENEAI